MVVEEEGMGWPAEAPVEYVTGTVSVVEREIVVAGWVDAMGPAVTALEKSLGAGVTAGEVAGVGTKVIVFGTWVTIPGLALMCGAQMPAR